VKGVTLKQPQPSSPTRRAFLGRSAAALSASPFAFAFPSDARSMTASGTDAVRRGIDETNHRFEDGFNRGDAAGAARQFYTRDARILPPGAEIVQGRDRIAEFWAAAAAAPKMGVRRVELSTLDLQPLGDWVYTIGRAMLTLAGGQRATPKYVVVWKQEDGAWRRHLDIWNTDTA
jgi:ketosteroid isomerase-like protein